ncbi:hypothetical protein HYU06_03725 [Candidatus Woesearchaeota archaeon]|nr:hypothetical protein [Candidatus Woesearchaeota archaeon]
MCYKFAYDAANDDMRLSVYDWSLVPPNGLDCDVGAIAGFWESGKPQHPWYENLTEKGTWATDENRYWGNVTENSFDYFYIAARAHTNKDSQQDDSYDPQMEKAYSIYCAPTGAGCNNISNYSMNCGTSCYNKSTYMYIYSATVVDTTTDPDQWNNFNNELRTLSNLFQRE